MSEPTTAPAPGAPAPAPTAPAPAAPATATSATDPAAEIARLQAEVDRWKGHSRDWEGKAKANSAAQDAAAKRDAQLAKVAEALGLAADEKPDPDKLVAELARERAERTQLARERAVLLAAHSAGADAAALLDSRAFVSALEGIDPTDAAAVTAAVKAAIEANPRYALQAPQATAPTAPPVRQAASAGQFNGSPGAARQLTAADVRAMSGAELGKAAKAGLLADYFATPNQ